MRTSTLVRISLASLATFGAISTLWCKEPTQLRVDSASRASAGSSRTPTFIENRGQWQGDLQFACRRGPYTAAFEKDRVLLRLPEAAPHRTASSRSVVVALVFEGALDTSSLTGEGTRRATHNYYLGRDRKRWRSGVPSFSRLRYKELYPSVDVEFRGPREATAHPPRGTHPAWLEYDIVLDRGASLEELVVRCEGIESLELASDGSLLLHTKLGTLRQPAPETWYERPEGVREPVTCRFRIVDHQRFGFEVPDLDPDLKLVIDPTLEWMTHVGGDLLDWSVATLVHEDGSITMTGRTDSTQYPATPGLRNDAAADGTEGDVMVTRLNAAGGELIFSTVLGGAGRDEGNHLAVAADGSLVVAGYADTPADAEASGFPTTNGSQHAGDLDAFVLSLSNTGELQHSRLLGGSGEDSANSIAPAADGSVLVGGYTGSSELVATTDALQAQPAGGAFDWFVARLRLDNELSGEDSLPYFTYFGTEFDDTRVAEDDDRFNNLYNRVISMDVLLDAEGHLVITAWVVGTGALPVTEGAYQTSRQGGHDGYVGVFDLGSDVPADARLRYGTYLGGGQQDGVLAAAAHANGDLYLTGQTHSGNFPRTDGAFLTNWRGSQDAWVARLRPRSDLAPDEQLLYSTFLGSTRWDTPLALDINSSGLVAVAGETRGSDSSPLTEFPQRPGAYEGGSPGNWEGFVTVLNPDDDLSTDAQLVGSILVGNPADGDFALGVALSDDSHVTVVGGVDGTLAATPENALQPTNGGDFDAYVAHFDFRAPEARFTVTQVEGDVPFTVSVDATASTAPEGKSIASYHWTFGDGSEDEGQTVKHNYTAPGCHTIQLEVVDSDGNNSFSSAEISARLVPTSLEAPWVAKDIGETDCPGGLRAEGSCWTISQAHGTLRSTRADAFHFLHQPVSGNVRVEATLASWEATSSLARAGVMLREHDGRSARHVSLLLSGNGRLDLMSRQQEDVPTRAGDTTRLEGDGPFRVRIDRDGDLIRTSVSRDGGLTWEGLRDLEFEESLSDELLIGLAAAGPSGSGIGEICDLTMTPLPGTVKFRRGDANSDGIRGITDAIFVLRNLFLGGPPPSCLQAADTNADNALDIADPVLLLTALFTNRSIELAAPATECGRPLGGGVILSCESFPACDR